MRVDPALTAVPGVPTVQLPAGEAHPQGAKRFNGRTHQVFGSQNISRVQDGMLVRVHRTSLEDGLYDDAVDYTAQPF